MADSSNVAPAAVTFDLNTAQRPANTIVSELFTFRLEDRVVEMSNPHELDFKDVQSITNPVGFFKYLCSVEDREFIRETKMELWEFRAVIDAMLRHYKFDKANLSADADI